MDADTLRWARFAHLMTGERSDEFGGEAETLVLYFLGVLEEEE